MMDSSSILDEPEARDSVVSTLFYLQVALKPVEASLTSELWRKAGGYFY